MSNNAQAYKELEERVKTLEIAIASSSEATQRIDKQIELILKGDTRNFKLILGAIGWFLTAAIVVVGAVQLKNYDTSEKARKEVTELIKGADEKVQRCFPGKGGSSNKP